ncbi:MAG TPA: NAD(P)-dependent oxidoreductase [Jatrophihabitans sp.]|nr:NAD(P)-dependent oxidoreductase [Jatrophihabitans sp.]
MGLPIGVNLAKAGLPLRAWNRSPEKAQPLTEHGVTVTETAGDAVAGAEVVLTMLYDADSVAEVMRQAADRLTPSATWIQLTTVGVDGTRRLAELAGELGLVYLDSPVLGTRKPAEDGTLVVLAAGPDEARPTCQPIFDAIGGRTVWLNRPGDASKLKLVANAWVIAVVEGIAESLTLAEALGLDPALFLEAVRGGAMDAPYVQLKGNSMIAGDWAPSFGLSNADKDARLILQAARSAGVDMAITQAAHDYFDRAMAAGHGEKDLSAILLAHDRG